MENKIALKGKILITARESVSMINVAVLDNNLLGNDPDNEILEDFFDKNPSVGLANYYYFDLRHKKRTDIHNKTSYKISFKKANELLISYNPTIHDLQNLLEVIQNVLIENFGEKNLKKEDFVIETIDRKIIDQLPDPNKIFDFRLNLPREDPENWIGRKVKWNESPNSLREITFIGQVQDYIPPGENYNNPDTTCEVDGLQHGTFIVEVEKVIEKYHQSGQKKVPVEDCQSYFDFSQF